MPREPFDRSGGERTRRIGPEGLPTESRRDFLRRIPRAAKIAVGGAAAVALAKFGVHLLEEPDPVTGIKAVITLTCGDSRHVGKLVKKRSVLYPNEYMHVSNAGAYPGEDLRTLINHLVSEKKLKRSEILVIGTAHYDPPCGAAGVNPKFIHHVRELLHHEFGLDEHKLGEYLVSHGHTPETVLVSVEANAKKRAQEHARLIKGMGVHHLTGIFEMDDNQFHPVSSSHPKFEDVFSMEGVDFEGDPELETGQTPDHLLLSVPGANGRGNPEGSPHWIPGKSFFVSVNPQKPSTQSQLSILYYAYLTAKEHEEMKKVGQTVPKKKLVLAGTKEEVEALKKFIEKDALAQHLLTTEKVWELVERVRKPK